MTELGYVLIVAQLSPERRRTLGVIASAAQLEIVVHGDTGAALAWLAQHSPRVVLFDTRLPRAEELCSTLRSKRELAGVPVIAVTSDVSDVCIARLYTLGADDVVPVASGAALASRLRALATHEQHPPGSDRGLAVIALSDPARCDVVGRVLMNAGHQVKFALDERALRYYATQDRPRLIVMNAEMGPPRKTIEELRREGVDGTWIVASPRRDVVLHSDILSGLERVAVIGADAPPESILFLSNELNGAVDGTRDRESSRMLYGTLVAFRNAGAEQDELGFTYNISANGMYIRTLVPPDGEDVWLELRPPRSRMRLRLQGKVVWRLPFDRSYMAAAPPGFGVRIQAGLADALERWHQAYASFAENAPRGVGGGLAQLLAETLEQVGMPGGDQEITGPLLDNPAGVAAPAPSSDGEKTSAPVSDAEAQAVPVPSPALGATADNSTAGPSARKRPLGSGLKVAGLALLVVLSAAAGAAGASLLKGELSGAAPHHHLSPARLP